MRHMTDEPGWFFDRLATFGSQTALIDDDIAYTYHHLCFLIEDATTFLKEQGVPSGDVVAICSGYSVYSIALFFALVKNRNVVVPIATKHQMEIDDRVAEGFVDYLVDVTDAKYTIRHVDQPKDSHRLIQELTDKNRAGLILFSSGSTGKAKAMVHDLDTLLDINKNRKTRQLTIFLFLMFDHIGGLNTLFQGVSSGATLILSQGRDPEEVGALIEKHKVSLLPTTPTFLNLLLLSGCHQNFDFSSLRMISYGTEPMPESLLVRLKEAFPRTRFLQTFGTSETGVSQVFSRSSGSVEFKIDDSQIDYKVIDGELWLRSQTQILGYLNDSMERFSEDGWFKTGDLVEVTPDNYIKIIGRAKEVINVGGEKVLPAEIESVLLAMPEVHDCLVYGLPNVIMGQMVVADIMPAPGVDVKQLKKNVRLFCQNRLEAYKVPSKINVVSKISVGARHKKIRNKA